ncbi:MAG: pyridoxal-dependent decarboxylase [Paracoccaceae bacterium]
MTEQDYLQLAAQRGMAYRQTVNEQNPYPRANTEELRALFDTGLPEHPRPGNEVLTQLADAAEAGLVAASGDAFYGWVMGASDPVGTAADWLTSAWGQNSAIYQTAPSAAIAEEIAGKYLIDLLCLPAQSSFAFTTGATVASFIGLAAARSEILHRQGWDLEKQGMFGAPEIPVLLSKEAHSAISVALRYLGFGSNCLHRIKADADGRMRPDDLAEKLAKLNCPSIVIAQSGHINTGACDNLDEIGDLTLKHAAWLHVDGAFGLWASASPTHAHLCAGVEKADSWAVDGHKWLQVPFDSGFAFVKNKDAHCRAMAMTAGYLNETPEDGRNPTYYSLELSRRARGFSVWAVLQSLGRAGVREIVDGNCNNATRLAKILVAVPGIRLLHNVVLNQVSLVFEDPDSGVARTVAVVEALQKDGRWFVKEAQWRDETIMRLSFSSTTKTDAQIDEFGAAILACWEEVMLWTGRS